MDMSTTFPNGLLRPELFIGVVSSVSAYSVKLNLSFAGYPSGSHFSGGRYGRGEVGEFVLIEGQKSLLLGRIVEVKLPETDRKTLRPNSPGSSTLDAIGTIQLLGSVAMDNLEVKAGVCNYPRLGDRTYSAPHRFISQIPTLMDMKGAKEQRILLNIGSIDLAQESTVVIRPEKLFGRHCAILGTTGSGKSWTTARIIEECIKYKPKIILLDPTNEYRNFSDNSIEHYHLGDAPDKCVSESCSLPPNAFMESDFIALFEPAGKVQGPKLRAAIRSLRLAKLRPDLARDGFIRKINEPKKPIEEAEKELSSELDDPRQPFDVNYLVSQIEQECVYPEGFKYGGSKGEKDPAKWGGEDGNFSHCLSLVTRINAVLTSPAFSCVFRSSAKSILKLIDKFLQNSESSLFRICVGGIAYEYKAREIIANAIGRALLNKAHNGEFQKQPIVIILDEAHHFLGRSIGSEDYMYRLDAFELIAKEGRKYGLSICLATQRPRDITEGVLSQIGTLIVHRLINDQDREVVERACGEIDRAASAFLPNLRPGEAVIIGADFPIPLTIQVFRPTTTPNSDGPNFQNHWKIPDNKDAELPKV